MSLLRQRMWLAFFTLTAMIIACAAALPFAGYLGLFPLAIVAAIGGVADLSLRYRSAQNAAEDQVDRDAAQKLVGIAAVASLGFLLVASNVIAITVRHDMGWSAWQWMAVLGLAALVPADIVAVAWLLRHREGQAVRSERTGSTQPPATDQTSPQSLRQRAWLGLVLAAAIVITFAALCGFLGFRVYFALSAVAVIGIVADLWLRRKDHQAAEKESMRAIEGKARDLSRYTFAGGTVAYAMAVAVATHLGGEAAFLHALWGIGAVLVLVSFLVAQALAILALTRRMR